MPGVSLLPQSHPHVSEAAEWYILGAMIEEIREKISAGQFEFSKHAVDQSIVRRVTVQEIREAIAAGEIIEDYPDDKYGPSCLLFGRTQTGRPLHIQCSYASRPLVKIVTLYEPDASLWVDSKVRR
jgi:anti-sigma28 factor (negative regulator of flagellin synthesis)